jgi:hypothetical protein
MKSAVERLEMINKKLAHSKSTNEIRENSIKKSKILNNIISLYHYKGVFNKKYKTDKTPKNFFVQKSFSYFTNLPQISKLYHSRNYNEYSIRRKLEKANENNLKTKLIKFNNLILRNNILNENIEKTKVRHLQSKIGKKNVENFYKLKKAYVDNLNKIDISSLENENNKMIKEFNFIRKLQIKSSDNIFQNSTNSFRFYKSYNTIKKEILINK